MKIHFWMVPLCALGLGEAALAASKQEIRTSIQEVVPEGFQAAAISEDIPASDLTFDPNGNLWIAGKTAIWRWSVQENRMQKIPIPSVTSSFPLRAIIASHGQIFAATDKTLYRLSLSPAKLVRYDFPNYKAGQTSLLSAGNQQVWWVHKNGIFKIDQDLHLRTATLGPILKDGDHAYLEPTNHQLWYSRGENLFVRDLRLKNAEVKLIYHASGRLNGIGHSRKNTFTYSAFSVFKFDQSLRLSQAIPVEGARKLALADFSQDNHTYLFSDNLLEVFNLRSESTTKEFLDLGSPKTLKSLVSAFNYTAVIVDGVPRLFKNKKANENLAAKDRKPKKG